MPGPTIRLIDMATAPLGCTIAELAAALQLYVDTYLAPEWGVSCTVLVMDPPPAPPDLDIATAGEWALVLMDDSDQADALGYHQVGINGEPRGFAFVKTSLADGTSPTIPIGHELAEMLVDPMCSAVVPGQAQGEWLIQEICDPVEGVGFEIDAILLPNFVTRAWFEAASPIGARMDLLDQVSRPFALTQGGYTSTWTAAGGWTQGFGSELAMTGFMATKCHRWSRHGRRMAKRSAPRA